MKEKYILLLWSSLLLCFLEHFHWKMKKSPYCWININVLLVDDKRLILALTPQSYKFLKWLCFYLVFLDSSVYGSHQSIDFCQSMYEVLTFEQLEFKPMARCKFQKCFLISTESSWPQGTLQNMVMIVRQREASGAHAQHLVLTLEQQKIPWPPD